MTPTTHMIGTHDIVLLILDTLRFDVAREALADGATPGLGRHIHRWQARHTPASFTLPAHQAFFAGFLPTPVTGPQVRRFACAFDGSTTIGPDTVVFDAPHIVAGLAGRGYRTVCIGGTGFFNPHTPLGRVLPGYFQEAHWSPALGVTDPHSFEHQLDLVDTVLAQPGPCFLYINVSAIHQPNSFYGPGGEIVARADPDTRASHRHALAYVDGHIPRLWQALERRGPALVMVGSDHGTAYGEDGLWGHRVAHPVVWTVPWAELEVG